LSYFPVQVPADAQIEMELYDVNGRCIARRASTRLAAGDHLVPWVTPRLASGTYTVRLRTPAGVTSTARWTIVR
jgi:hypothetical protein